MHSYADEEDLRESPLWSGSKEWLVDGPDGEVLDVRETKMVPEDWEVDFACPYFDADKKYWNWFLTSRCAGEQGFNATDVADVLYS